MNRTAWAVQAVAGGMIVVAVGVALWSGADGPRRHVAIPPPSATPTEVVAALVQAWDAHDTVTARALYDPRMLEMLSGLPNDGLEPYDHVRLDSTRPPYDVPSGDGYATRTDERWVGLGATLDVQGTDGSQPDGAVPLGFDLVQSGPGRAWRVVMQGLP